MHFNVISQKFLASPYQLNLCSMSRVSTNTSGSFLCCLQHITLCFNAKIKQLLQLTVLYILSTGF